MCGPWVGGHCRSDCAEWWVAMVRMEGKKDEVLMRELASGVEHVSWLRWFGLDPLSVSQRLCFKRLAGMIVGSSKCTPYKCG